MLRLISTLFFLFAFLCSGCSSNCGIYQKNLSGPELAAATSDSTVALVVNFTKVKPFCTGVWISDSVILTANHCVEALAAAVSAHRLKEEITNNPDFDLNDFVPTLPLGLEVPFVVKADVVDVGIKPSAVYFSKSFALSKEMDLALLRVRIAAAPIHTVAKIADSSPAVGENVAIVGHPSGLYWSYITGVVSAYHNIYSPDEDITGPFMQVSAPAYFGNSGGGAFNQNAELVGICSLKLAPPNTALFVQLRVIQSFLAAHDLYKIKINTEKSDSSLD